MCFHSIRIENSRVHINYRKSVVWIVVADGLLCFISMRFVVFGMNVANVSISEIVKMLNAHVRMKYVG